MLKLSALEIGLRQDNTTDHQLIDQVIELAPQLENCGYHRLWIGEHQDSGVAWRNTEVLLSILAGVTADMRIGAAGVLLYLQSPLRVAQHFKMLNYLYADRIDLGLARGKSRLEEINALLQQQDVPDLTLNSYFHRVGDLMNFLDDQQNSFKEIAISIPPMGSGSPDTWILGTGKNSIEIALNYGLNFSFSMFHPFSKIREAADILEDFRKRFEDRHRNKPIVNVAIAGVCATSEEKALSIANNFQLPFPVPQIVGTPEQCKEQLLDLQDQMGVEEIVFTDISNRFQDKVTSYALLADSLSLKDASAEVEQMTAIVS